MMFQKEKVEDQKAAKKAERTPTSEDSPANHKCSRMRDSRSPRSSILTQRKHSPVATMNEEIQNPLPELTSTPSRMLVLRESSFHETPPAAAAQGVAFARIPVQQGASLLLQDQPGSPRMQVQGSKNATSQKKRDDSMVCDPCAKTSPHKRAKRVNQQDPFDLLTDDATLFPIFEFIGPHQFRFIAGVSRRFRRLYSQFQLKEWCKRVPNPEDFEKLISTSITSTASIAESLSRAKFFLDDTGKPKGQFQRIKIQKNGSQKLKDEYTTSRSSKLFLRDKVAVRHGKLDIVQWIIATGSRWDMWTCAYAANGGHLNVLQWARENGYRWRYTLTCAYAAKRGHLKVLQWAREDDCPWDETTCKNSARSGHLEVLQWARENGCPWDESTCSCAARMGYLEVLQWGRENGCPWDKSTCEYAALRRRLVVLRWARENGCPWN